MRHVLLLCLALLCTLLLTGGVLAVAWQHQGALQVAFLDIGQGDSILMTSTTGRRILVDTGPDETVLRRELAAVLPPLQKRIDLLLLTHSDGDHINGASMVLTEYEVGMLLINNEPETSEEMAHILQIAEEKRIPIHRASYDKDIAVDQELIIDLLTPLPEFTPAADAKNNFSIAFMALTPSTRLLFTGDAEEAQETALVAAGLPLQAPWLKGGHHGSKTSTTEDFLQAVRPSGVIFQNGKDNQFKHPAQEVMDRLAAAKIPVYNTGTSGRITLHCPDACTLTTATSDDGP